MNARPPSWPARTFVLVIVIALLGFGLNNQFLWPVLVALPLALFSSIQIARHRF